MKTIMLGLFATGVIGLAIQPSPADHRIETDPDQRAVCVGQLLALEQEPVTMEYVVGTLNYTDLEYGGPCAALEHRLEHGWY